MTGRARPGQIDQWLQEALASPTDDCLPWPWSRLPTGYGRMGRGGRVFYVSHHMLELSGRPRPTPAHHALHSCDNPPCVNPAHLRWGTSAENAADMISRFRQPHRAFTPEQLHAVREAYAAGEGGYLRLARRFGVSRAAVQRAVRGITYGPVT